MLQERLIDAFTFLAQTLADLALQVALIFYESAFYILLGFLAAGLLREFVSASLLQHHMGKDNVKSVFLASLLGAPLPLCSCGVLPMAVELRHKGASRSAITSFLISTPETGVDSIALTYALMGPVMAIVRPIMAIATAFTAGLGMILLRGRNQNVEAAELEALIASQGHHHDHDHGHDHHQHAHAEIQEATDAPNWLNRVQKIVDYGFRTVFDEIAIWIFGGLVLTGVLVALLPADFFSAALGLGSGVLPMLLMVIIGIPIYMCASASTPIAAALVATGLSPGAALVFLLAGPATNLATISVVMRLLGYAGVTIYLIAIISVAIAGGMLVDAFLAERIRDAIVVGRGDQDGVVFSAIKWLSVAILGLLFLASFRRGAFTHGLLDWQDQNRRLHVELAKLPWRQHGQALAGITGVSKLAPVLGSFRDKRVKTVLRAAAGVIAAGLLFIAVWPLVTLSVGPGQRGIVQAFGNVVDGDLPPGLHLHLPWPLGRGQAIDVSEARQIEVGLSGGISERIEGNRLGPGLFLTGDENIIEIGAIVQYRIDDPVRFAFEVEPAEGLLRDVARRHLTRLIAAMPIDPLYSVARHEVEHELDASLKSAIADLDLGYRIERVRLLYLHAPATVHDVFRDVASALEDQTEAVLAAEGRAAEVMARAESRASETRSSASADALRLKRVAEGETAPFAALADVVSKHEDITKKRLHLEALERYLVGPEKLVNGIGPAGDNPDLWLGGDSGNALRLRRAE